MKKWQKTLVLILAVVMVVGLSSAALAASVTKKQLTAEYSGIQITLDGQKIEPKDANGTIVEPFIVDGTTYLPVRALSNAFGLDVDWDQATQTVVLTTPEETNTDTGSSTEALTEVEYKAKCQTYTYNEIARNPENYVGTYAKYTGEVVQVMEGDDGYCELRITITKKNDGYSSYYTDAIYASYTRKLGESRLLEGDLVTAYGQNDGLFSYITVRGDEITVPYVVLEYVELIDHLEY